MKEVPCITELQFSMQLAATMAKEVREDGYTLTTNFQRALIVLAAQMSRDPHLLAATNIFERNAKREGALGGMTVESALKTADINRIVGQQKRLHQTTYERALIVIADEHIRQRISW